MVTTLRSRRPSSPEKEPDAGEDRVARALDFARPARVLARARSRRPLRSSTVVTFAMAGPTASVQTKVVRSGRRGLTPDDFREDARREVLQGEHNHR